MADSTPRQIRASDRYCCGCMKVKLAPYFLESPVSYHNKYLPLCKNCCQVFYRQYLDETDSEPAALWLLLARMNIPFIEQLYQRAHEDAENDPRKRTAILNAYLKNLRESNIVVTGFIQSTNMLTDYMGKEVVEEKKVKNIVVIEDLERERATWGNFYKDEGKRRIDENAYDFLNKTFEAYTKEIAAMDTNLTNRYRDLCKCEWRLRKANEAGDGAEISKAQDALNKQLVLMNLNNFQVKSLTDEQKAFERRISIIENTKPAECEDLQKYLDMVGYEKEKSILKRSLFNAVVGTRDYPDLELSGDK